MEIRKSKKQDSMIDFSTCTPQNNQTINYYNCYLRDFLYEHVLLLPHMTVKKMCTIKYDELKRKKNEQCCGTYKALTIHVH